MMSLDLRARLACLYAGSVWGLFWIPLRGLDATGMHSLWVTVVYFGVPVSYTHLTLPTNREV